jgi:hypothetical protein
MPRFKIAHVKEQGVNLIIVPLDSAFGHKVSGDQKQIIGELQLHARAAGLAGTIVPVWDNGGGRMAFIAPRNWHSFFASLNLQRVFAIINHELYW